MVDFIQELDRDFSTRPNLVTVLGLESFFPQDVMDQLAMIDSGGRTEMEVLMAQYNLISSYSSENQTLRNALSGEKRLTTAFQDNPYNPDFNQIFGIPLFKKLGFPFMSCSLAKPALSSVLYSIQLTIDTVDDRVLERH